MRIQLWIVILLTSLAVPCFASRTLKDELGRTVEVPDHPHRVFVGDYQMFRHAMVPRPRGPRLASLFVPAYINRPAAQTGDAGFQR